MEPGQQRLPAPRGRPPGASAEDWQTVEALRRGDEAAFADLVAQHQNSLLRLALAFVPDQAAAEDVVGDTWLGVLRGLDRFEGRSSLKTWIFRILANRARSRGRREGRSLPFSALPQPDQEDEAAVPAGRFLPADHPRWAGHWSTLPGNLDSEPEASLLAGETLDQVRRAIAALPSAQQAVITLRDGAGWSAAEVCEALEISEANQRVLLHRARSKVRRALEEYFVQG